MRRQKITFHYESTFHFIFLTFVLSKKLHNLHKNIRIFNNSNKNPYRNHRPKQLKLNFFDFFLDLN